MATKRRITKVLDQNTIDTTPPPLPTQVSDTVVSKSLWRRLVGRVSSFIADLGHALYIRSQQTARRVRLTSGQLAVRVRILGAKVIAWTAAGCRWTAQPEVAIPLIIAAPAAVLLGQGLALGGWFAMTAAVVSSLIVLTTAAIMGAILRLQRKLHEEMLAEYA